MSSDIPVKVYVRARPFNKREIAESAAQCLSFYIESNQLSCNGKMFAFDSVMDSSTSQETAFEVTTGDIVEKLLKGFNCTIIAYGQTGSGKTYSMGTEETTNSMQSDSRGIIPRLVQNLFSSIAATPHSTAFQVLVSMLEIYDEKVNDLLSNSKDLQIREQNGSVLVQGLQRHTVTTLEETMRQLEVGCQLRSKGETAMNATSSRSHAIFTISVDKAAVDEEDSGFKAKLHLVDLAGSERLKKTQAEGDRKREGININQGLLALGNVISALSEPSGNSKHIPYRDSKITRLLQDSLGGNSYTVMIACVSPADSNAEETLSTLRYADRAKKIKNKPVVNEDAAQASLIKTLQEKNRRLEAMLAEREGGLDAVVRPEEVQKLEADLLDSRREVRLLVARSAEALVLRNTLYRQVDQLKGEKEKLRETLSVDRDETEAVELLRSLREILAADGASADQQRQHQKEGEEVIDTDDEDMDESIDHNYVTKQFINDEELVQITDQMKRLQQEVTTSEEDKERLARLIKDQEQQKTAVVSKLESLQAEHAKVLADLKKVNNTGKLSEERRQRVNELEKTIASYKKKLNELKKLEKQKADLDEKTKKLTSDIVALKQQQVQNMKKSKEMAEQYRVQKQKADRQLAQLKAQERKKEVEFVRQTRDKEKKIDVLKKKLEESARLNKRLVAHQNKKAQIADENSKDATKSLKKFVEQELSASLDIRSATKTNDALVASRRKVSKELKALESEVELNKKALKEAEGEVSLERIRNLKAEISVGEAKIKEKKDEVEKATDMMQMLGDQKIKYDMEARADERWANIKTLSHGKLALKLVFDLLLENTESQKRAEAEVLEKKDEVTKAKAEATTQLKIHKKAIDDMQKQKDTMKRDLTEQLLALSSSIASKPFSVPEDANMIEVIRQRLEAGADVFQERIDDEKESRFHHEMRSNRKKPTFFGDVVDSGSAIAGTPDNRTRRSKPQPVWEALSPIMPAVTEKPRRSSLFVNRLQRATNENIDQNALNQTIIIEDSPAADINQTFDIPTVADTTFVKGKEGSPRKRLSEVENADAPPMKIKSHDVTLGNMR